jgi:hypothetical protein
MRKALGIGIALGAAATSFVSPANAVTIGTFTGGDVGEGLDLDGNFLYAVNARGPAAPGSFQVRDALFTVDSLTPGVSITSTHDLTNWHAPSYGATTNDDNLEIVMQSIRWSAAPSEVVVTANGLIPGHQYKVQMLFGDNGSGRNFDVVLEGNLLVNNFTPGLFQTPPGGANGGAVITETFIATDTQLNIRLTPSNVFPPTGTVGDNNPILQAFTVEDLTVIPEPATGGLLAFASLGFIRRRRHAAE